MRSAVIVAARRTPLGRFLGHLAPLHPAELAALAARAALQDAGVHPSDLQEALFGCARQAGVGPNIARQAALRAGLPESIPAFTVNQACASSLQALILAARSIALGEADLLLAGGMESMSRVPFLLDRARTGYRLGHAELIDAMYRDGFLCPLSGLLMGETAERLAERCRISRDEQDAYAAESQRRCEAARREGRFDDEIVPVPGEGEPLRRDETPRDGVTVESLAKLPPVFKPGGTVHAGNSCGIADGAAALVVASDERARSLGLPVLARITGWASAGVAPADMGLGPVPAIRNLERATGLPLGAFDLVELNEAFAAQVLACDRELRFDRARLNVNGGAIALGHPIGATGARLVTTLLHEMRRRGARRGLAALCASGGLGVAVAFER
ncbi:MAG TPA: thiolase family protein [Planctomycetota bacterium]|jgi:acetyl-CoA C-acetyltransferase|nr:thiolase family protein [Planctomycetota bacterium]